jgi:hypothetical protein
MNTLVSYQTVYGNIFNNLNDVFKAPYVPVLTQYYNQQIDLAELNDQLIAILVTVEGASRPFRMLQDSIVQAVVNNPGHPINFALKDNNTYTGWLPKAPIRLYYCTADDQVPFNNSILARDSLLAAGPADLQISDVAPAADHGGCVVPALTSTLLFFLGYQQISDFTSIDPYETGNLALSPNPAGESVVLRDLPAAGQLTLTNFSGQILRSVALSEGDQTVFTGDLPDGVYLLQYVAAGGKTWTEKLVIKH